MFTSQHVWKGKILWDRQMGLHSARGDLIVHGICFYLFVPVNDNVTTSICLQKGFMYFLSLTHLMI